MLDYSEKPTPLSIVPPNHIEVSLDTVPTNYPYLPRICSRQGYVFMWHTNKNEYPNLYQVSQNCKTESQWFTTKDQNGIELALALIHEYDNEVIIGCVKTAGYLKNEPKEFVHTLIKNVWKDIIKTFGHKKIICPSSSYLEYIHLFLNQKRIPHTPYCKKYMTKNKFYRIENYWIRDGLNNKTDRKV
jgi:hypothetical protein